MLRPESGIVRHDLPGLTGQTHVTRRSRSYPTLRRAVSRTETQGRPACLHWSRRMPMLVAFAALTGLATRIAANTAPQDSDRRIDRSSNNRERRDRLPAQHDISGNRPELP